MGRYHVNPGRVLYLALEDSKFRLRDRLKTMLDAVDTPENFDLGVDWPRLDEGGIEKLREWALNHDDARLIIIDTLEMVRSQKPGSSRALLAISRPTAREPGSAIPSRCPPLRPLSSHGRPRTGIALWGR